MLSTLDGSSISSWIEHSEIEWATTMQPMWLSDSSDVQGEVWTTQPLEWRAIENQWLHEFDALQAKEWITKENQWLHDEAHWMNKAIHVPVDTWQEFETQWRTTLNDQWVGSPTTQETYESFYYLGVSSSPVLDAHAWQNVASLDVNLTSGKTQCDSNLLFNFVIGLFAAPQIAARFTPKYKVNTSFSSMTIEAGATCPILRSNFKAPELYFRMAESYNTEEGFERPALAAATGIQLDTAIPSGASLEANLYVPMGVFGQEFEAPQIDAFAGAHVSVEVESASQLEAFTGGVGEAKFQLPTITIDLEHPSLDGSFPAIQIETATGLVLDTDVAALALEASTKNPFVEAQFSASAIQGRIGSTLELEIVRPTLVVTLDYPSLDAELSTPYLQGRLNRIGLDNLYEYACNQAFHALEIGLSCTSPILDVSIPQMQASMNISANKFAGSFSEIQGWGVLRSNILEDVLRYKGTV